VLKDKALVDANVRQFARTTGQLFLTASSPHSGDWVFRSAYRLLWSSAWRWTVGLRLGLNLCISPSVSLRHSSWHCKKAPDRSARHRSLVTFLQLMFVPITKEPVGLFRTDGRRPDGLTPIPWQSGKSLWRDVTVTCPLTDSYVTRAAHEAGAAAELAAFYKLEKYVNIDARYLFFSAVENLGVINTTACHLQNDRGRRMTVNSGNARVWTCFLHQCISVLIQRYNAVLFARWLHGMLYHFFAYFCLNFKLSRDYISQGSKW